MGVLNGKSMLQKQQLFKGSHKKCTQNSVIKSSNSKTDRISSKDFFFEDKEKDNENIPLQKANTATSVQVQSQLQKRKQSCQHMNKKNICDKILHRTHPQISNKK